MRHDCPFRTRNTAEPLFRAVQPFRFAEKKNTETSKISAFFMAESQGHRGARARAVFNPAGFKSLIPKALLQEKKTPKPNRFRCFLWRRVRDLNPGYGITAHTISSRAPSTTQPTLHTLFTCSPERIYPFLSATIFIIAHEAGSVKPFLTFSAKNFFRFSNRSKRQAGGQKEHGHTQQTAQQSQPDAGQHRAAIPPHRIPEAAPSRLLPGQK